MSEGELGIETVASTETLGIPQKTLDDLDWDSIVRAWQARCVGPRLKQRQLPIASTREGTAIALEETREAMNLLDAGDPLPLGSMNDVTQALQRLSRLGVLDGPSLRDVRSTVSAALLVRRFLGARKQTAPRLYASCLVDPTLDRLVDELDAAIEPDGTVSDRASSELRRLRTEIANLRGRLVARLEQMMHERADILSDRFYTIREGRYVLPVRTDAHEKLIGIVHGTSQSGATVFVEPRALIGLGNRLKMAQAEAEREEQKVLAELSDLTRERLPEVMAAMESLDHADLRAASARLGRDMNARVLPLAADASVHLATARHPGLLLEFMSQGGTVVPNDLSLKAGHGLVLSGPNAGGKTVALKTLGLAALMVRAGLAFPADEGSECGFFSPVLSDVGDEQSIVKNLSTFSAHITNLAAVLDDVVPGALVLLDELATGTDPLEGAALACAYVEAVCDRGAALAVTTHYESLKALALRDGRLRNGSVGFDVDKMEPTFSLAMDVPGASSALSVARRFGIPHSVIERAKAVLPEQAREFEALVGELGRTQRKLAAALVEAEGELAQARSERVALQEELKQQKARGQARLDKESEKVLAEISRLRGQLKDAKKKLRERDADEAKIAAARAALDAAAQEASAIRDAQPKTLPGEKVDGVAVGDQVWVERLRSEARVVAVDRQKVQVMAGVMKLWVTQDDLRQPGTPAPAKGEKAATKKDRSPAAVKAATIQSADNSVDVRGLRVDDALPLVESFLDRMYGMSEPIAYIIHGVGSGALRDAIRQMLKEDGRYVREVRAGRRDEGGEGVSVVTLR